MKNENNVRVNMFRVDGDLAPFVQVGYLDKNAQKHTGLMILDSCSNKSILSREIAESITPVCKEENKTTDIITSANTVITLSHTEFCFVMGGKQFREEFCVSNGEFPCEKIGDLSNIGLLGNEFMQRHGLTIDYREYSFHTSIIEQDEVNISDCDYFFPIEKGLKDFGIPIVLLSHKQEAILAMADTGATHNMIASHTINDRGMEYRLLEEKDFIMGIDGKVEVDEAIVKFNLASLTEDGGVEIPRQEQFKVSPYYLIAPKEDRCDENGNQLPPVEAIIGSPFMAKEGWVLDFGKQIIYKRKSSKILFLDIDGVLNSKWWYTQMDRNTPKDKYGFAFDPRAVANLKRIVEETGADIVMSSSWKCMGLSQVQEMWSVRNLPGKIIGITPSSGNDETLLDDDTDSIDRFHIRGEEIKEWLKQHGKHVSHYVIIDDMDNMLSEHQSHYIQTNPEEGITENDAEKAITILNKLF